MSSLRENYREEEQLQDSTLTLKSSKLKRINMFLTLEIPLGLV